MSNTIKPQDMRIKNIVQHNGVYWHVTDIMSPAPRKDKRFDGKWVIGLMNGGVINVRIDEIEPISLTEDILFKAGFIERPTRLNHICRDYYIKIDFLQPNGEVVGNDNEISFTCKDGESPFGEYTVKGGYYASPRIEHLHQLQNLFYSLTSRELEIKL